MFYWVNPKRKKILMRHPWEVRKPGSKPTGHKIRCKIPDSEVSFPPFYLCGLRISF